MGFWKAGALHAHEAVSMAPGTDPTRGGVRRGVSNNHFEPDKLDGFFDIKSDPSRLVHMPAGTALLLRGDVAPARETLLAPLPLEAERRQLSESQSAWTLTTDRFGVDAGWSQLHGIGLDLEAEKAAGPALPLSSNKTFLSNTGQLRWDVSRPGAGYFTVDTPWTKIFTGFIRGRTFHLGNVVLAIGSTRRDWATVTMTVIEGQGFDGPGRILIAATGLVQSKGAQHPLVRSGTPLNQPRIIWRHLASPRMRLCRAQFSDGPFFLHRLSLADDQRQ